MKRTFKYLNDNRKSCVLGIQNFMPENQRIVKPCEVATFEIDVEEDEVIFIKTWKHEEKILVQTHNKSVWEVQGANR
jgi:hypothetical protein